MKATPFKIYAWDVITDYAMNDLTYDDGRTHAVYHNLDKMAEHIVQFAEQEVVECHEDDFETKDLWQSMADEFKKGSAFLFEGPAPMTASAEFHYGAQSEIILKIWEVTIIS